MEVLTIIPQHKCYTYFTLEKVSLRDVRICPITPQVTMELDLKLCLWGERMCKRRTPTCLAKFRGRMFSRSD